MTTADPLAKAPTVQVAPAVTPRPQVRFPVLELALAVLTVAAAVTLAGHPVAGYSPVLDLGQALACGALAFVAVVVGAGAMSPRRGRRLSYRERHFHALGRGIGDKRR